VRRRHGPAARCAAPVSERVRRPASARHGGGDGRNTEWSSSPASVRGIARATETTGFSPMRFSWFLAAPVRGRTSFLNQETISSYLVLFPRLFICHVILSA
jgi:hypothetical protein